MLWQSVINVTVSVVCIVQCLSQWPIRGYITFMSLHTTLTRSLTLNTAAWLVPASLTPPDSSPSSSRPSPPPSSRSPLELSPCPSHHPAAHHLLHHKHNISCSSLDSLAGEKITLAGQARTHFPAGHSAGGGSSGQKRGNKSFEYVTRGRRVSSYLPKIKKNVNVANSSGNNPELSITARQIDIWTPNKGIIMCNRVITKTVTDGEHVTLTSLQVSTSYSRRQDSLNGQWTR